MANKKNPTSAAKHIHKQLRATHHRRNRARTRTRVTRYGFRNFARNAWLSVAATAVMTVTLLIIFATAVISQLLGNTIVVMNEKVSDVSVYFASETSDDTLRVLAGKLRTTQNVIPDSVKYEDSEEVYNAYTEDNKNDPIKMNQITLIIESGNDPRTSFPAKITLKIEDPNNLEPIKKLVDNDPDFVEWLNQEETYKPSYENNSTKNTIDSIIRWSNLASTIGLAAAVIFLLISILVIFNTIRMAIFSRRDEIDIMKSIGADRFFIRGPFLIEAQMYGFFAAIIATGLGYLAVLKFVPGLENYGISVSHIEAILTNWWFAILGAMMFVGMLIGYVSAYLAVRKHLK